MGATDEMPMAGMHTARTTACDCDVVLGEGAGTVLMSGQSSPAHSKPVSMGFPPLALCACACLTAHRTRQLSPRTGVSTVPLRCQHVSIQRPRSSEHIAYGSGAKIAPDRTSSFSERQITFTTKNKAGVSNVLIWADANKARVA